MSLKLMELKRLLGQKLLKMMVMMQEKTALDHQVEEESGTFLSSLQVMRMFLHGVF